MANTIIINALKAACLEDIKENIVDDGTVQYTGKYIHSRLQGGDGSTDTVTTIVDYNKKVWFTRWRNDLIRKGCENLDDQEVEFFTPNELTLKDGELITSHIKGLIRPESK